MNGYVILAVSNDDLELPIACFTNYEEMQKYTGKSKSVCYCSVSRGDIDRKLNCKYIKVKVEG